MLVTEIDAASNTSVDNVRQVIVNSTTFSPPANQYRVFIVDEVHQLSGAAFNALLKTIEEPPPRVLFIMATTELQKVPDTILSRCQVFEFKTIPLPKVIAELGRIAGELGIKISESALGTLARAGEGSMRDAESALDQVISFAGTDVSDEDVSAALGLPGFDTLRAVLEAVADQDAAAILRIIEMIVTRGYDIRNFCREVMTYVRNLLVVKVSGFDQELTGMPQSEAEWIGNLSDRFSDQDLIRFFSILSKTEQDIRLSSQPRFQLEIGLVKMAQSARLHLLEEAIERMAEIEARMRPDNAAGQPASSEAAANKRPAGDRKLSASRPVGPLPGAVAKVSRPGGPSAEDLAAAPTREPAPPRSTSPKAGAAESPRPATTASSGSVSPNSPTTNASPDRPNKAASTGIVPAQADEPNTAAENSQAADNQKPLESKVPPSANHEPSQTVEKLRKVLEDRKKMMLSVALGGAERVSIEGPYLILSYASSNRHDKTQVENARQLIEEACVEALGTRLTLSVSFAGSAPPQQAPGDATVQSAASVDDPKPENHPAVRAVVERFNGEIIGVEQPER